MINTSFNEYVINYIEKIELDLSTICNCNCPLCFRNKKTFPFNFSYFRPFYELVQQLDKFKNLKECQLIGQMSEPTLYYRFFDLIKYLKHRSIRIVIYTNGDTNDNDFWLKMSNILTEDDIVKFTVCGTNQRFHEIYRRNSNLNNILKHAQILYHKCDTHGAYLVFDYNKNDSINANVFFKKYFKKFSICLNNTFDDYSNYYIDEDVRQKLKHVNDKDIIKINKYANILFKQNICQKFGEINCLSINEKFIFIDFRGNCFPCYLMFEHHCVNNCLQWSYDKIKGKQYLCCINCQNEIINLKNKFNINEI